jgi:hypothetical protein
MVLLFGCRRSDQDYLYGPQLESWSQSGDITLFTAFSRQQVGPLPGIVLEHEHILIANILLCANSLQSLKSNKVLTDCAYSLQSMKVNQVLIVVSSPPAMCWPDETENLMLPAEDYYSGFQAEKVYVQQRLRENADLVWSLLHEQNGHFYVCGDASSMAGAVETELLKVRLGCSWKTCDLQSMH